MRFPWANVTLLILLLVQVVTGYIGLVNGRSQFNWVLWLHGIGAYGLVVLLYWKNQIILDALRRKSVWTWQRVSYLVMLALLLVVLVMGLLWTFVGPLYIAGFSLLSLHIYLAIPLMVLMLWHSWRMRFVLRLRQTWGRRLFLGTAAASAAGLALWRLFDWSKARLGLPGSERRFTGSYETGSFTGRFPVVSWIADRPPPVDAATWRLAVEGAVERPLRLTYDELQALVNAEETAVLDCTGGWYTEQIWHGVPIKTLLAQAGVLSAAQSVTFEAVSGYKRRFTLQEAERYLLALYVAGRPLTHGHGFPARLVAPDQRGVEWVKWVGTIRVNRSAAWLQAPLPLQ